MSPAQREEDAHRIGTLDGWRGLAIALVLMEHAGREHFPDQTWAQLGNLGVDIFFVLSGYIITARLLMERDSSGTINLKTFYVRRAFRILPLVLVYLSVIFGLSLFLNTDVKVSEMLGALFFFRNYQFAAHPGGIYTSHFWSLSIEEHFYLFWPVLLLKSGNRRALWIAGSGAYLCAIWRIWDYDFPNGPISRFLPGVGEGFRSVRTDVRLDGLLLGSVMAILLARPVVRDFVFRNFPKESPLVLAVVLMMLNQPWAKGYGTLTYYSLIALIIASTLMIKEGLAYKLLNSRLLIGLGTISYSIYVWQQLFLLHPESGTVLGMAGRFPLNLLCVFLVSSLSYYLLERPLVRFGHKLSRRWTADRSGLGLPSEVPNRV
jgi:peptidoglycan/LPS O-acetylase OafA/YrhL